MENISNFQDVLKEVANQRDFDSNHLIGGIRESENDFFYDKPLLEEIYNLNSDKINSVKDVYNLRYLLAGISYSSESERISSISLNLGFDFNKIKISLPKNFEICKSDFLHPENVNQLNIFSINKKNSLEERLHIASMGFYLSKKNKNNFFILTGIQGEIHSRNPSFDRNKIEPNSGKKGNFLTKREMKRKTHRIFGKLNNFYKTDWRTGLIRELKLFGKEKGFEMKAEMPPIFYLIGSSISKYPLYSMYFLNSSIQSGISLKNINFKKTPIEFKEEWKKIKLKIVKTPEENFDYINNLSIKYRQFFSVQEQLLFEEEKIGFEEYEKNCINKFKELVEEFT